MPVHLGAVGIILGRETFGNREPILYSHVNHFVNFVIYIFLNETRHAPCNAVPDSKGIVFFLLLFTPSMCMHFFFSKSVLIHTLTVHMIRTRSSVIIYISAAHVNFLLPYCSFPFYHQLCIMYESESYGALSYRNAWCRMILSQTIHPSNPTLLSFNRQWFSKVSIRGLSQRFAI